MVWSSCLLLGVLSVSLSGAQQLYEGSGCFEADAGQRGVCTQLKDCRWAQEKIKNKKYPQMCAWAERLPIVCCPEGSGNGWQSTSSPYRPPTSPSYRPPPSPPPTKKPTKRPLRGSIAKKKCQEYAQYVFREEESYALSPVSQAEKLDLCVTPADVLIIGGEEAKLKEFPHMALVGYGDDRNNIEYQCGGSLISPDFVLTAAHCIIAPGRRPARWVLLGELDRSTTNDGARTQTIEVKERIRHPDYKPPQHYSDIALLRLKRSADLSEFVRPACLNVERDVRQTTYGGPMATGWGHTEWAGDPSEKLLKVSLELQPFSLCNRSYQSNIGLQLPKGILDDVQMCAGVLEGGKDTCQGDSGGPLQVYSPENPYCVYYVIGVTSFGKACGFRNSPAVYTRVSEFVPWIENIVWPNA